MTSYTLLYIKRKLNNQRIVWDIQILTNQVHDIVLSRKIRGAISVVPVFGQFGGDTIWGDPELRPRKLVPYGVFRAGWVN